MCRMLGYIGAPIAPERIVTRPRHSLLEQAQHADEAKLAVNGDGFGMAWYTPEEEEPGLYRDVMPAWSDANLGALCRVIRSGLFLAHVRAGTSGGTSRANCHPFTHGPWSFCHNGQLGNFTDRRRALEFALPDALYALRAGSTDSELLFLTLLSNGLETDAHGAITATLAGIGAGQAPDRITCVLSDGKRLMGFRHASDDRAPTLYLSKGPLDHGGRAIASEPLDGVPANWVSIPEDTLVTVEDGHVTMAALETVAVSRPSLHRPERDIPLHRSS